jgi:hypothetical protein
MNEKYTVCKSGGANIPEADPKSAITRCRPSPHLKAHFETPLIDWVSCQFKSHVGVTVTFGAGRGASVTYPSQRNAEEMVRKAIKRLNTQAYGNGVKRKGFSIGAVTAFEGTGRFERIHAHMAFEPPPDMSFNQFSRLVDNAFKRSKWIEQRPHVKECWSQDWINYTLKLGQEALKPSCCFAAKHPVA